MCEVLEDGERSVKMNDSIFKYLYLLDGMRWGVDFSIERD